MILQGHSTRSLAHHLDISPGTVKIHRKNMYRKLNISTQAELFAAYLALRADAARGGTAIPRGIYPEGPVSRIIQIAGKGRQSKNDPWEGKMTKSWYSDLPQYYQRQIKAMGLDEAGMTRRRLLKGMAAAAGVAHRRGLLRARRRRRPR